MKNGNALTQESGQTMAEYAFVLGVISIIVITSLTLFSNAVAAAIGAVDTMIKSIT